MLSNSLVKDFQIRLGNSFILKDVEEEFKDYFDVENGSYSKMIDFLNNTIIGATVLGLEALSTQEQLSGRGTKVRTHNSSLPLSRKRSRTITLTFSSKKTFLNYMILYRNMESFNDGDNENARDGGAFYDNIFLDMLDSAGNIVYSFVYREIQINKISEIGLSKNDRSISVNEFSLDITYNQLTFSSHLNKNRSDLNDSYKHNFEK